MEGKTANRLCLGCTGQLGPLKALLATPLLITPFLRIIYNGAMQGKPSVANFSLTRVVVPPGCCENPQGLSSESLQL